MAQPRFILATLAFGALFGLAGCGEDKPSEFVAACMKEPSSASVPEAKRKLVCGCLETDALGKIADPEIKKIFTEATIQAASDPAKMQSAMTGMITKLAGDPAKLQAFQQGAQTFATGAGECAKKAM